MRRTGRVVGMGARARRVMRSEGVDDDGVGTEWELEGLLEVERV